MTDYAYAAKIVAVSVGDGLEDRVRQEADLLRELNHPRVVQLADSFDNSRRFVLVME